MVHDINSPLSTQNPSMPVASPSPLTTEGSEPNGRAGQHAMSPLTRLYSKTIDETWGTRQRLAALSGVKQEAIDEMIDRALRKGNAPRLIKAFKPQSSWLWRQWSGTVLQHTWPPAAVMMLVSATLVVFMEHTRMTGGHTWTLFEVPDPNDGWVARLKGFTTMWGYLLTMATFVNSFFLSQACERPGRPLEPPILQRP